MLLEKFIMLLNEEIEVVDYPDKFRVAERKGKKDTGAFLIYNDDDLLKTIKYNNGKEKTLAEIEVASFLNDKLGLKRFYVNNRYKIKEPLDENKEDNFENYLDDIYSFYTFLERNSKEVETIYNRNETKLFDFKIQSIRKFIATQVDTRKIDKVRNDNPDIIIVADKTEEFYVIQDGHHRIINALINNKKIYCNITAKYVFKDLDQFKSKFEIFS